MHTIGRSDRVDLPQLALFNIHAKVDTGAYSCCLHCQKAEIVNGKLEFILLDEEHPEFTGIKYVFSDFQERDIKNSFGEVERRFVIQTTIKIFDEEILTTFSLSNRGSLKFPVLLGRKILRGRFLVDVAKVNQSYRYKKRKSNLASRNDKRSA